MVCAESTWAEVRHDAESAALHCRTFGSNLHWRRIFDNAIFDSVERIASLENRVVNGRIFSWRNVAGLLFVHVLADPNGKRSSAGCVECRRAGDDAVKIIRENL